MRQPDIFQTPPLNETLSHSNGKVVFDHGPYLYWTTSRNNRWNKISPTRISVRVVRTYPKKDRISAHIPNSDGFLYDKILDMIIFCCDNNWAHKLGANRDSGVRIEYSFMAKELTTNQ